MSDTTQSKTNSRTKVIKTLIHVQNGQSLSTMLDVLLTKVCHDDKSFVHNLLLSTLRHWHATARLLDTLADKPIDEVEIRTTIQVGITQLIYLDVADHASIYETVESVKELGFARASGLVNAILRKVAKNPAKYRKQCDKKHSLPNWLAKKIKQDWREQYDEICQGLRHSAPMFLRVNQRQSSVQDYSQQLSQTEVSHEVITLSSELLLNDAQIDNVFHVKPIQLTKSSAVSQLPSFDTGMVSVQDSHASIAGSLVAAIIDKQLLSEGSDNVTPVHILDACTAPSGKLAHCLELFNHEKIVKVVQTKVGQYADGNDKFLLNHDNQSTGLLKFTAIDVESNRLERSQQTLSRLGLTNEAKLICADATSWHANADAEEFDLILLDAPCTATGVIRRHPDISLLRQESDIDNTVELQRNILENLWPQLKPNGYMIYATCSILKAENVEQMQKFIAIHHDAKEIKISGNWGIAQEIGRQCLPLQPSSGDGFYYAVLKKDTK